MGPKQYDKQRDSDLSKFYTTVWEQGTIDHTNVIERFDNIWVMAFPQYVHMILFLMNSSEAELVLWMFLVFARLKKDDELHTKGTLIYLKLGF